MSRFTRELKEFEFKHNYSFAKPNKKYRIRYALAILAGFWLGMHVGGYLWLIYHKAEAYDDIAAYLSEQTAPGPVLENVPVLEP